jgi:hypothetical protein
VTLVDTSVWVDHFRRGDDTLAALLTEAGVHCHPFIIGELACGRLRQRQAILALLANLPQLPVAEHEEVLAFVERHQLMGSRIGWVDAHLLAAARLTGIPLWTRDKGLRTVARRLGVAAEPPGNRAGRPSPGRP